jgi:hypothetical protein
MGDNRIKLYESFDPIFNLNSETKVLSTEVLSSAIRKLTEKAREYITPDNVRSIPIQNNERGSYKEMGNNALPKIYNEDLINYFVRILDAIEAGAKLKEKEMTIAVFNVISLQFIILFTEILLHIIIPLHNKNPRKYGKFEERLFDDFIKLAGKNSLDRVNIIDIKVDLPSYTNYDTLKEIIEKDDYDGYGYIVLLKNDTNNIKPGTYIILFLGNIDIYELTKAFINEIYIIGLTMEMENADGNYLTPLEFLIHDISHSHTRINCFRDRYNNTNSNLGPQRKRIKENNEKDSVNNINNSNLDPYTIKRKELSKKEKEFVNYIDTTTTLNQEQKHDIYIILFFIIHESCSEYLLEKEINMRYNFGVHEINMLSSWAANGMYNGLLKDKSYVYYLKNKTEGYAQKELDLKPLKEYVIIPYKKNEDYKKIEQLCGEYIQGIKNLFAITWNKFFAKMNTT